ncbi:MAG: hypothetical protein HQK61_02355 [Desulfamplus sp.]|nr:hypothetical protein [Desulfamplus sp.]
MSFDGGIEELLEFVLNFSSSSSCPWLIRITSLRKNTFSFQSRSIIRFASSRFNTSGFRRKLISILVLYPSIVLANNINNTSGMRIAICFKDKAELTIQVISAPFLIINSQKWKEKLPLHSPMPYIGR